jgi:THO complex subunit 1
MFFFLSDIVLYLCEREHVEGGMIFQLLEDLTEMSTMRNCKDIFGYIESKQDILGKVTVFSMDIFVYFSGFINLW